MTGGYDHTARLWDAATWDEVRVFTGHTDQVESAAFSPDGRYVLTGSRDQTARLWETDYHDFIRRVCSRLFRDLTDEERTHYSVSDEKPACER